MRFKLKKQHRLPGYDYSQSGAYFLTICTKDRVCFFGDVINGRMVLSRIGEIAKMFWLEIPHRFLCVNLDAWVIMPDHIHGILIINRDRLMDRKGNFPNKGTPNAVGTCRGTFPHKETGQAPHQERLHSIHPLIKNSISSIINHYKGNVKRYCNKNNIQFSWQSRFHDHIIRNERSLAVIRKYIINNPKKWEQK